MKGELNEANNVQNQENSLPWANAGNCGPEEIPPQFFEVG